MRKALKKYQFCSAYRVSRASHPLMSVSRLLHYQCEEARRQAHSSLVDGNSYALHEKKARKSVSSHLGRWKLIFCTEYRHWRTGKLMRASDYGYKAWPFKVWVPVT